MSAFCSVVNVKLHNEEERRVQGAAVLIVSDKT